MREKIIIYGGSFDPIHVGHLITAASVLDLIDAKQVVFLPSFRQPLKEDQDSTSFEHRCEMVRLSVLSRTTCEMIRLAANIEELSRTFFAVDESEARHNKPSYTFHTITFLKEFYAEYDIAWLMSEDSLADLYKWYRYEELIDLCQILIAQRGGKTYDYSELKKNLPANKFMDLMSSILPTPQIEVSSTDIRRRVQMSKPIRFFVTDDVVKYIYENHLYRGSSK